MNIRWEYKTITLESTVKIEDEINELNKYGEEYWELISVINLRKSNVVVYYFKKQKYDPDKL